MNSKGMHHLLGLEDPVGLIRKKIWKTFRVVETFRDLKTYRVFKTQQVVLLCMLLFSCGQNYSPKPNTYFRIDFPEREYRTYDSDCPFTFEYPVYGTIMLDTRSNSEPCWFNINFPKYRGTIYFTYKEINNNFDQIIEDNWRMLFSGIAQKADAIEDFPCYKPEINVFGMFYDIKGNAASAVQFFVTDSVKNFLRGSLYFTAKPNSDSLAPVVAFFREDVIHLMESIRWKTKTK